MAHSVEMELILKNNSKEVLDKIAKQAGMTTDRLIKEIERALQAVKKFEEATKGIDFKKIAEEANKQLPKVENKFKKMAESAKKSFDVIQRHARRTFLAIVTFSGISLRSFAKYEHSVNKIRTISKDSYREISTHIRKLAYDTGISSKDISQALYDTIQVVQDIPEKYKVLEIGTKLGKAGSADTAQSIELLAAAMLSYNLTIEDTEMLANKLLITQTKGNITIGKMSNQLGKVLPTAKLLGISMDEILASLSALTAGGIRTEQATTGIRAFITEMGRSSSKVSKLFTQLNGGIDFKNFMASGGQVIDALEMLSEHAEKTDSSMVDMFRNIRSVMAAGALTGMKEKYMEFLDDISNAPKDTLQTFFDKVNKDTMSNMDRIKETVVQYSREIGKRLSEDLAGYLDITNKVSFEEMFSKERIDKIYATGKALFYFTGAITALGLALKGLEILGATLTLIVKVGGMIKAVTATIVACCDIISYWVLGVSKLTLGGIVGGIASALYGLKKLEDYARSNIFQISDISFKTVSELEKMLEAEQKKLNELKESNKNFESSFTLTGIEEAEKNIKRIEARIRNLSSNGGYLSAPKKYSNDGYLTQPTGKSWKVKVNDVIEDDNGKGKNKNLGGQDAFSEFISSIGAKIKNEFNIEEKIEMLEKSKDKFKSHIKEINIAIENFKGDLFKEKIDKLLKGISLDNHSYSANEKVAKLEQTKAEIQKRIDDLDPIKNKKEIADLKEKIEQLDFTEFNTKFNALVNNIKAQQEKLSSDIKNRNINSDEAKRIVRQLKTDSLSVKNIFASAESSGLLTGGDKEKDNKAIIGIDKGIEIVGEEADKIKNATWEVNDSIIKGFDSLSSSFNQLGSATGSKTLAGIGNIMGQGSNFLNVVKKNDGLLSGGAMGILGVAGAAIGVFSSVKSLLGASGKKKKAKIERENKRQLQLYEKTSNRLLELTKAIEQNSKKLQSFADRLNDNVSKNPTLNRIMAGKGSLGNLKEAIIQHKEFGDISAVELGRKSYRKWYGKKKHKTTYTNRLLKDDNLLKYLGFKANAGAISESNLMALAERVKTVNTNDLKRAMGKNYSQSNLNVWSKNIQEYAETVKMLNDENSSLFKGSTLGSFTGIDYKSNVSLIKEYRETLKNMGINADGEHYNEIIKSMVDGNNVLITSMQDVRSTFIDGLMTDRNDNFISGMKSYFTGIFKNVSSVIYDVGFSDFDESFSKSYEKISEKLVKIKSSGKLNFNGIFDDFDFKKLESANLFEKQYKKQIDKLKEQLMNSGVDFSIVERMLPTSDFNKKMEEMRNAIQNALGSGMNVGLTEHKFESFTMTIGQSLYESTKGALTKAFGESKIYQNMLSKYFDTSSIKAKLEKATSLKEVFSVGENIMKNYGMQLEAAGFGGFGAVNNKADMDSHLGNAYYQDKAVNVKFEITNNFHREVYGVEDFKGLITRTFQDNMKEWEKRPKVLSV